MNDTTYRWCLVAMFTGLLLGFLAGAHEGAKHERVIINMERQ